MTEVNNYYEKSLDPWIRIFKRERLSSIYEDKERIHGFLTIEQASEFNELKGGIGVRAGQACSFLKEPIYFEKRLERLKLLFGQFLFENLQVNFFNKYGFHLLEAYKEELKQINEFIEEADKIPISEAFSDKPIERFTRDKIFYVCYKRLKHEYYLKYPCCQAWGSTEAFTYGKYFLYRDWLEENIDSLTAPEKKKTPTKVEKESTDPWQNIFKSPKKRLQLFKFFKTKQWIDDNEHWIEKNFTLPNKKGLVLLVEVLKDKKYFLTSNKTKIGKAFISGFSVNMTIRNFTGKDFKDRETQDYLEVITKELEKANL